MKILKFGGTSVGTAERMHNLVDLIGSHLPCIVVLSAMSGTTNKLIEISSCLINKNPSLASEKIDALENQYSLVVQKLYKSPEGLSKGNQLITEHFNYIRSFTQDLFTLNEEKAILAQGELLSTALFQFYLEEQKVDSTLLPALNFMRIDENEEPDMKYITKNLQMELSRYPGKNLFITQGFICRNAFGEIDNLKRGGSDYTASLLGAALDVSEIQIWTDIDGMHNNDPRIVNRTFPIAELTFDEAAELAYFGAKILHPSSVNPARDKNIPVRLLNTMQPDAKGTTISSRALNQGTIKAIAAKDGIVAIKIKSGRMLLAYGFLRTVFEIFERYRTPIDMITTSEVAVSLTIDNLKHLDQIQDELRQLGNVEIDHDQSIICVVGDFSPEKQGYAGKVMDALKSIPVRMISYGGSENNISILISSRYKKDALMALNDQLFEWKAETV